MIKSASFGRQILLLLLCGIAIAVLGNAIFGNSKATFREPAPFRFPQQVPLEEWHLLDSQALADQVLGSGKVSPGWRYRYQHASQPLNIEMRYIADVGSSSLDLPQMLGTFTQIPPAIFQPSTIRDRPEIGFYSLFAYQQTTYLSACINPRGGSTVTGRQFKQNRLLHDVRFDRLFPWILGRATLWDYRCLWTILSLPRDGANPDASERTLETAGMTWLRWWQVHFPDY